MDMGQPPRPQPPMVSVRLLSSGACDAKVQAAEVARRARSDAGTVGGDGGGYVA